MLEKLKLIVNMASCVGVQPPFLHVPDDIDDCRLQTAKGEHVVDFQWRYREVAAFSPRALAGIVHHCLREASRGLGSIQFYVDHDPQTNYLSFDESMAPQLSRFAAFDYVVNNADRKGGHCLIDSEGHLWGIDHGIAFHVSHKLRTVIWDFAGQACLHHCCKIWSACGHDNAGSNFRQALCNLLWCRNKRASSPVMSPPETRRYPLPGPFKLSWPPV
jgi:hypothetical protein